MIIQDLFAKDINRSINGVVKVQQEDDESIKQELSEYVVTRELQGHFATFFESYESALDVPTDKVGVWISGFFGSGKSHFLKMLSYLLANKEVAGKRAIDYFDGKVLDPMVAAKMRRCAEVPTEAVLFNIDSKGSQWKTGDTARTALLRTFERVFFENLGFYGEDLKLAKLEDRIDQQGKTAEFRAAFARLSGGVWEEDRAGYTFFEDDVVAALQSVLGMSEQAARHWFDGSEDDVIAPDAFAERVQKYVDARAAQHGGQFRLLFMVDEAGQYIGDDVSLMLNLQTLVEELGARCQGRVWIMVTSQEAIDEVAMVVGDDFSKIQGRFNTRLSLSSSSVDEVIQRRVLEKTPAARAVLEHEFDGQSAVLKNLFDFTGSRGDLVGYASQSEFCDTYPFVSYQFKVLPDAMEEIRKHGVKAQHMSTGERSMLSAFQESAQAVQREPLSALVPFWRFFDTISKDLEHGIIRVVDNAQRAAEAGHVLREEDVRVLKLLYLIRHIDYIKPTLGNISVLMIDRMDVDKVALRESVKGSLDRLVGENYVARQGDAYNFLTDEEQDIAREIAATDVEAAAVIDSIKKVLFESVYTPRKLRRGANDFPFDRYVDGSIHGLSQGGMKLSVVTMANDLARASDGELALRSSREALVVLSDDADYWDIIQNAAKIRKYIRTKNVSALPPSTQNILRNKQNEAAFCDKEAAQLIENAVVHARCAVDGRMVQVRATNAKQVFERVLEELVGAIFTKADYIGAPAESDEDIRRILRGGAQESLAGMEGGNARAAEEVTRFLETQERTHQQTTMEDVQRKFQAEPYGWRDIDVACVVAGLVAAQNATVSYGGQVVAAGDKHMVDLLRKHAGQAVVRRRVRLSDTLLKQARDLLVNFGGVKVAAGDEDALVRAVTAALDERRGRCMDLVRECYTGKGLAGDYPYPGQRVVEDGLHVMAEVFESKAEPEAFLRAFVRAKNDLLDFAEDMERIDGFFPNQQRLFDEAVQLLGLMAKESFYVEGDADVMGDTAAIKEILQSSEPYERIRELPELMRRVNGAHDKMVSAKRAEVLDKVEQARAEVANYVQSLDQGKDAALAAASGAERTLSGLRERAHKANAVGDLDAMKTQLESWTDAALRKVDEAVAAAAAKAASERVVTTVTPEGQVVKNVRVVEPAGGAGAAGGTGAGTAAGTGGHAARAAAAPRLATPRAVKRADVCERGVLSSEADVDAYVERVRTRLLEELAAGDPIRLS